MILLSDIKGDVGFDWIKNVQPQKNLNIPEKALIKMDLRTLVFTTLAVILALFVDRAHAFDAGDGIMLFLGLVLGILGIFAILGCIARRSSSSAS